MNDNLLKTVLIMAMVIIMLLLLLEAWCRAEPYLIYNPTIVIEKYEVELNGEVEEVAPNVINDNSMQLVYDLKDIPVGANNIRARALFKNWGWCPWSVPFQIIRPGTLENPQVTTNP